MSTCGFRAHQAAQAARDKVLDRMVELGRWTPAEVADDPAGTRTLDDLRRVLARLAEPARGDRGHHVGLGRKRRRPLPDPDARGDGAVTRRDHGRTEFQAAADAGLADHLDALAGDEAATVVQARCRSSLGSPASSCMASACVPSR